jgi:hypothetical protein
MTNHSRLALAAAIKAASIIGAAAQDHAAPGVNRYSMVQLAPGAASAGLTKRKCRRADVIPRGRGLRVRHRTAVIVAMSTKTREVIWGGRIMGADMRAETARQEARKAARAADRAEAEGMVDPHGRLWRPGPAVPNDRPMPEWRLPLAGDRMLPMQDKGEPATGCYPQGARYADLEARAVVQMPVVRHAPL